MNNYSSTSKAQILVFVLILISYTVVAGLFAVYTPPWQAPDEPAHYNYAAQIAMNGCCPVIEVGDWDSAYLDQLKATHFAPELLDNLPSIQYEDHQPPLYYLFQSVVYRLSGGSLVAMRFFSALIGLGVVWCAYRIALILLPDRPQVALGAAALTAFLPQHLAVLASVNNDSLSGLVIGLTLLGMMAYLKDSAVGSFEWNRPAPLLLGILVGIGLLTKLSTLFLVGLVPIAIALKWWTSRATATPADKNGFTLRRLIIALLAFTLPVLLLGGIWWLHNFNIYGFPDLFGQRQHNLVVADQARTADFVEANGFGQYLKTALQTTFNSFWGQFGWMALPLPGWLYPIFLALLMVSGSGLVLTLLRRHTPPNGSEAENWRRNSWIVLALTAVFALLAYIYYNLEFLQLQGRYLFSGIIPFSIGVVLGVDSWLRRLFHYFPAARWLTTLFFLTLALLDIYLLFRVIEPLLRP